MGSLPGVWACPRCHTPLEANGKELRCAADGIIYGCEGGIPRLLDPQRGVELRPFIEAYKTQRADEGWGVSQPPAYYLNLPFKDVTGENRELWRIRARHMNALMSELRPVFERINSPVVLDAGAGNCWLSYRLAERKARPFALDLNDDAVDGLGVADIYRTYAGADINVAQAELERLPITTSALDAVIINGSLHYVGDPAAALAEGWRALKPGGVMVVMDSPFYHHEGAGQAMREEFIQGYIERRGKEPASIPGKGYLTYDVMRRSLDQVGILERSVRLIPQHKGMKRILREAKLALSPPKRELATHPMWVARRET